MNLLHFERLIIFFKWTIIILNRQKNEVNVSEVYK